MDLARRVYSRELKVAAMREIDSGRTMELRDPYWSKREAGWLGTPIEGLLRPEPTTSVASE